MNMYIPTNTTMKPATIRVLVHTCQNKPKPPAKGSFLDTIINPPEKTKYYKHTKLPIYNVEYYLHTMEQRNHTTSEKVEELREYYSNFTTVSPPIYTKKPNLIEDEDTEKYMELLSVYYKNNKEPPIEAIVKAFRILGYTDKKIENIVLKHTKHEKFMKKIGPKIDDIFSENKKKSVRPKKAKKEPEPEAEIENEDEEREDEDETVDAEDNEFDVEPDEEVDEPEEYVDNEADD